MPPDKETVAPPAGADLESVTVQEVLALEVRLVTPHCNEMVEVRVRVMLKGTEVPLRDAVIVAVA